MVLADQRRTERPDMHRAAPGPARATHQGGRLLKAKRGGEGVWRTDLARHASPSITRTEGIQSSLCQSSLYVHTHTHTHTLHTLHFQFLGFGPKQEQLNREGDSVDIFNFLAVPIPDSSLPNISSGNTHKASVVS